MHKILLFYIAMICINIIILSLLFATPAEKPTTWSFEYTDHLKTLNK